MLDGFEIKAFIWSGVRIKVGPEGRSLHLRASCHECLIYRLLWCMTEDSHEMKLSSTQLKAMSCTAARSDSQHQCYWELQ